MYSKKILSMAAAAAIVTTGAIAFDTTQDGELLTPNSDNRGLYDYATAPLKDNNTVDVSRIKKIGDSDKGNALIFPAFFGGSEDKKNEWKSEFSVINTSDKAVIAKVVLYGEIDSVELRDFNIYLSAHDVFRATLKNGKIYSTDGSTIYPDDDNIDTADSGNIYDRLDNNLTSIYKYTDDGTMVSKDKPLELFIDLAEERGEIGHGKDENGNPVYEHNGYIVVFAMAEAKEESYHNKHKELWQDYRHLVDTCRSQDNNIVGQEREWRDGITFGLYNDVNISTPNRYNTVNYKTIEGNKRVRDYYNNNCRYVYPSTLGEMGPVSADDAGKRKLVEFVSPSASLTGSILVSNPGIEDRKGHRDLLIKAYALDNVAQNSYDKNDTNDKKVTDENDRNQILLWSEGEFAHIADRCIDRESKIIKDEDGNKTTIYFAGYNEDCVRKDATILNNVETLYEFRDNTESQLIVTQPYKRVLIQRIKSKNGRVLAWNQLINDDSEVNGQFKLNLKIYNDDENYFKPSLSGFIVSPATSTRTSGVPNEVSRFNPFETMSDKDKARFEDGDFTKGYSRITYGNGGISAIITQMAATIDDRGTEDTTDDIAETNWIYPISK